MNVRRGWTPVSRSFSSGCAGSCWLHQVMGQGNVEQPPPQTPLERSSSSEFREPLLHKPRFAWQGSTWSLCGAQTEAAFGALWIKGANTPRPGSCCIFSTIEAGFRWCWIGVGRAAPSRCPSESRAAAPAPGLWASLLSPQHDTRAFPLPLPPQDTKILSQDWLQGEAMPAATAYSYCFGSCRDSWHREKQSSPKCPRKAWGGKLEIHSSSWGREDAPGHRHKTRWQCWRRSSK